MKEYNARKKEESVEVKKRKQIFIYSVIGLLSIVLVYFLTTYILTETNVINQGYFRINDFIITSKVKVIDSVIENTDSSDEVDIYIDESNIPSDIDNDLNLILDVSQENIFSILVPVIQNVKIEKVYLSNIKLKNASENVCLIDNNENEVDLKQIKNVDVNFSENDGQYLIDFKIVNKDIINNKKLPDNVESVIYDGSILKVFDFDENTLEFGFSCMLNILDSSGKTSVCKIKTKLPVGSLIENGMIIERENLDNYNLKLKSKILEIFK